VYLVTAQRAGTWVQVRSCKKKIRHALKAQTRPHGAHLVARVEHLVEQEQAQHVFCFFFTPRAGFCASR